jgi:hypothetical protein
MVGGGSVQVSKISRDGFRLFRGFKKSFYFTPLVGDGTNCISGLMTRMRGSGCRCEWIIMSSESAPGTFTLIE